MDTAQKTLIQNKEIWNKMHQDSPETRWMMVMDSTTVKLLDTMVLDENNLRRLK